MSKAGQPAVAAPMVIPSFTRILLVTDFSSCSVAAVPFARFLAEQYSAEMLLVHVAGAEQTAADAVPNKVEMEKAHDLAEGQMRDFITRNELRGVVSDTVVAQGPVSETVAALVGERKIDLAVLGTRGRSGVGKLLMGSVAQRIFGAVPCAVLTVSPRATKSWGADRKLSRILYATDFSADALQALPYALSLAKVGAAELLLLHAPAKETGDTRKEQGYHEHLNALIPQEEKTWCRSDTLVKAGDPVSVILETAATYNVDFIVIGGHAIAGSLASLQVPLTTAYRIVAHAH